MFNDSQQRYLVNRLRSIEQMLSEAIDQLAPSDTGHVFRTVAADATAAQRKILGDYLAQLRFALRRFMLAQQLGDERRPTGGLWSLQTALIFAEIAAEELRPKYWRGYGEVDPDSAAAAERFAAELTTLLHRLGDYLARGEGGGIAARLAKLSGLREEGALLRELERIIFAHGLTELRAPLEVMVERAASPRFEIAVFGRVSAGKSSLLNWWLGQALLPTGVVPVTAVPTRIVAGERVRVRIERAGGAPVEVPAEEIAAYASEQGNPGNLKRVLGVLIEAPCERLQGGVRLVDTPGLGSLATAGAAQTLEYLPHCDLGILLIEAGAPLAPDDLDVARAILDSGSELTVVLSKADRLTGAELNQALAYVRSQLEAQLSMPIVVQPVSTVGGHETLAVAWFEQALAPRLSRHSQRAAEALRRKISVLRESVIAILDSRLRASQSQASGATRGVPAPGAERDVASDTLATASPPSDRASALNTSSALHEQSAQIRADFERAHSQLLDLRSRLPRFGKSVLEEVAAELARGWAETTQSAQPTAERIAHAVARCADEPGHAVARMLDQLRADVVRLVAQEDRALDHEVDIEHPRGRPAFDVSTSIAKLSLDRPRWLPHWTPIAARMARARVQRTMSDAVVAQLRVHADALYHWAEGYLEVLRRRFDVAIAIREGIERFGADEAVNAEAARDARRDLERLQQWPAIAA
ncbi:MAG TPA: dynamin family protein [Steroidobacteraceae bacterium]|nr:dynamin family protein [Steroidobacteraceae bacterium]